MKKKEAEFVLEILKRIKDPDEHVKLAITYVNKLLDQYGAMRGQLKDQYEMDSPYR